MFGGKRAVVGLVGGWWVVVDRVGMGIGGCLMGPVSRSLGMTGTYRVVVVVLNLDGTVM